MARLMPGNERDIHKDQEVVTRRNDEDAHDSRAEYDELTDANPERSFKEFLKGGPSLEGADVSRNPSISREIEW